MLGFHLPGAGQSTHLPVASTYGRLGGHLHCLVTGSSTWLKGHLHCLVVLSKTIGALHSHVPDGVAIVLGGQQILLGPVSAVPAGQTHFRRCWSKTIPLGQQASWLICS